MNTLALDNANWDLTVDPLYNIAMATGPYAIAQDVGSAIKLFAGELYYDTTQGVPYFTDILGQTFNQSVIEAEMNEAALSVPGVVQAQTTLFDGATPEALAAYRQQRILTGTVKVIDTVGQSLNVTF